MGFEQRNEDCVAERLPRSDGLQIFQKPDGCKIPNVRRATNDELLNEVEGYPGLFKLPQAGTRYDVSGENRHTDLVARVLLDVRAAVLVPLLPRVRAGLDKKLKHAVNVDWLRVHWMQPNAELGGTRRRSKCAMIPLQVIEKDWYAQQDSNLRPSA